MINGYMSIKETADKWHISTRRVQMFCVDGRIKGAAKLGREWAVPCNAEKPGDLRITTGKYRDWRKSSQEE